MARRRGTKAVMAVGSLDEPGAWRPLVNAFLESRRVKGFSEHTIYGYQKSLGYFIGWCEERNLLRPRELTRPILERYQRHLYYQRREDGRALSFRTQHGRMTAIVQFFRWLTRSGHVLSNPASDLELPKLGLQLPRTVLTIEEVECVMSAPDLGTSLGIRDRAILETLYSTGMRRSEACNLGLYDINPGGTVMIRRGKGRKDRMVPIGDRALAWVEKYLTEVRPTFVREPDEGVIFLAAEGEPLTPGPGRAAGAQLGGRIRDHQTRLGPHAAAHDGDADAGGGAPISVSSKRSWVTRAWIRLRSTRTWRSESSRKCTR